MLQRTHVQTSQDTDQPFAMLQHNIDTAVTTLSTLVDLDLPMDQATNRLSRFVADYCQYVQSEFREWRQEEQLPILIPLLEAHLNYRSAANDALLDCSDLEELEQAYLVMRVLEEVNDHFIGKYQQPLTRYDIGIANVIAGTVLGEQFAAETEAEVDQILMTWSQKTQASHHPEPHPINICSAETMIYQDWPCLARTSGLGTRMPDFTDSKLQASGSK